MLGMMILTMALMKELNIPISVRFVAKLLKDGISYDTRVVERATKLVATTKDRPLVRHY